MPSQKQIRTALSVRSHMYECMETWGPQQRQNTKTAYGHRVAGILSVRPLVVIMSNYSTFFNFHVFSFAVMFVLDFELLIRGNLHLVGIIRTPNSFFPKMRFCETWFWCKCSYRVSQYFTCKKVATKFKNFLINAVFYFPPTPCRIISQWWIQTRFNYNIKQ